MTTKHILFIESQGQVLQQMMQGLAATRADWHIVRVTND